MRQPDATGVIKFSSGRKRTSNVMENTQRMLAICIIACLAGLPLNSAFVKRDSDILKDRNFDNGLQNLIREQKQQDMQVFLETTANPMDLEKKLSEPRIVHDTRSNEEEMDEKINLIKVNKTTENIAQNTPISYNNVHDVMQALMLADNKDINERLQELRETKNSKEFKTLNNLPKRQVASASASASAAVSSNHVFGINLDGISVNGLDIHSCEAEAFGYGHGHLSGLIVHEFFCELKKLFHYFLIVVRDLSSELTLGPLLLEHSGIEISSENHCGLLHFFCPPIVKHFIQHPDHIVILPEIIRDVVPFASIKGGLSRFKLVFNKLLQFSHHIYLAAKIFPFKPFLTHHLGAPVLDALTIINHNKLNHLYGLGATLPAHIVGGSVVTSSSASAASAASSAGATASASATTYSETVQEILTSFKGFYNGYHASGIPHLFKSFSTSSACASIASFFVQIPHTFISYFKPIIQEVITTTTSSASSASAVTNIAPVVAPILPAVPVVSEVVSSSASATATVTETLSPAPIIPIVPSLPVVSSEPLLSSVSSSSAAAAAAAVPAVPLVSYPSVFPVTSPAIVSVPNVIEDVVAASSSSNVVVTPAHAALVPNIVENAVASASSSAVAGSGLAPLSIYPHHKSKHASKKSKFVPTVAAASASSSASSVAELNHYNGLDLNVNHPLIHPTILPPVISSSAAAASSASLSGASSSAASSAVNSLVLPRQKIVGALGYDHLVPGDIVVIALKKKGALFGHILDQLSPIIFKFLKPKLYNSFLHKAKHVWTLLPSDFKDPGCLHHFNDPLFLQTL